MLDQDTILHAVGQGALGIECRNDDKDVLEMLTVLNHKETWIRCTAERAFMRKLEGGCSVPLGVWTELQHDGSILLKGNVCSVDGSEEIMDEVRGQIDSTSRWDAQCSAAARLGQFLAEKLIRRGASRILASIRPSTALSGE